MEQPTTIVLTEGFYTSRAAIDHSSDSILEDMREGRISAIAVRVWIKSAEEIIDRVKRESIDAQLREADKYPGKTFQAYGATITKAETGTKYDYKTCGDTVWERLDVDTKAAASKQKMREEFLKTLKEPLTVIDDLTGEVVTILPPAKTSTSGLNVSIK